MTTCGGVGHEESCLCDVVITDVTPVNYNFDQVWHAGIVARAVGYGGGSGVPLADFLEALGSAYDATRRLSDLDGGWLDGIGSDGGILKRRVEEQLQNGHSMIDIPELLGESFERAVAAITGAQPCLIWTWDELKWLQFEAYLNTKATHSQSDLAERFGLTRPQCTNLVKLYGKGVTSEAQVAKAARAEQLFEQYQDKDAPALLELLVAEGHTYTLDGVRKARQRWRFRRDGVYAAAAAAGFITVTMMVKIMLIMERVPYNGIS